MAGNSSPSQARPLALVTSGAGSIGPHLITLLLASGWRARVLDNFTTGRPESLPAGTPMVDVIRGDIRDTGALDTVCAGVGVAFHLAALVSVPQSIESPVLTEEIHTEGTRRISTAAATCIVEGLSATVAAFCGAGP